MHPRDAFVYFRNHICDVLADLYFIPTHTLHSSKEAFAVAEGGEEHLLWDQLHCGPTRRQYFGILIAEESQMLLSLSSLLFFFARSEQREEKVLPS